MDKHASIARGAPEEKELGPHHLSRMGVLQAQVCSRGTWDEALEWLRSAHPAGTINNWFKDERPKVAPVCCETYPDRKHYLFTC